MRRAIWIVPGLSGLILLLVGVILFFIMLVLLNGFSSDSGGKMLITYLIFLVVTLLGSIWASRWGVQALALRTNWPLWISGFVAITATVAIATGFLLFDITMILFIGSEVLGMR
jgi:hypothetical protein